jgi:hypothetical protein
VTSFIASFVAGLAGWTLLEYAIHFWLGHLPRGRILISSEHLKHHSDILYFTPLRLNIRGAVPVLAALLLVFGGVFGLSAGLGFVAAVSLGWVTYEYRSSRPLRPLGCAPSPLAPLQSSQLQSRGHHADLGPGVSYPRSRAARARADAEPRLGALAGIGIRCEQRRPTVPLRLRARDEPGVGASLNPVSRPWL